MVQNNSSDKLSCDSNYVFADIKQNQYKKIVQPEKKSSKNVLFAVMLSLLTLIICHCVLKAKNKAKKTWSIKRYFLYLQTLSEDKGNAEVRPPT